MPWWIYIPLVCLSCFVLPNLQQIQNKTQSYSVLVCILNTRCQYMRVFNKIHSSNQNRIHSEHTFFCPHSQAAAYGPKWRSAPKGLLRSVYNALHRDSKMAFLVLPTYLRLARLRRFDRDIRWQMLLFKSLYFPHSPRVFEVSPKFKDYWISPATYFGCFVFVKINFMLLAVHYSLWIKFLPFWFSDVSIIAWLNKPFRHVNMTSQLL